MTGGGVVPATPEQWGERVKSRLSLGVAGAVEAGQELAEAKRSLPHGSFEGMIRDHVGIDPSTARRLMAIGAHEYIANRAHAHDLPSNWTTLSELAQLESKHLERAVAAGKVHPGMERREASALVLSLRSGRALPAISKPDLGAGVSHPARYSDAVLEVIRDLLRSHRLGGRRLLDPFAGTGRVHELRHEVDTAGVELEPEWAAMSEHTTVGNALALPFDDASFDVIATSPCYANRLADAHTAIDPHLRRSYTHDLGRPLHPDNAGAMQWGKRYRDFHLRAWAEVTRVLRPAGVFILNIKDHTRDGARQPVSSWHATTLIERLGFVLVDCAGVADVRHLRQGANADARWAEMVWLLRKPQ